MKSGENGMVTFFLVMTWEMKNESGAGMFFIIIWSLLTSLFANGSASCFDG